MAISSPNTTAASAPEITDPNVDLERGESSSTTRTETLPPAYTSTSTSIPLSNLQTPFPQAAAPTYTPTSTTTPLLTPSTTSTPPVFKSPIAYTAAYDNQTSTSTHDNSNVKIVAAQRTSA